MKKLVAIALVGIAAFAVLLYFARPVETDLAPAIEPEQPQAPMQEARPEPIQEPTPPTQLELPDQLSTAPTPEPAARLQPTTPPTPIDPRATHRAAASLTKEERQQLAACHAASQRKIKSEQAARDAEAKDPAWAYPMEQKLRDYTTRRFQTLPIDVISIDCKTTFCELKAQVFSREAEAELGNAMHALVMQPPPDFRGMSYSNRDEAGKAVQVVQLKRLQARASNGERPSAEQLACFELSGRQQERERAARDAEPRDAGWADPMEQLLREQITEKMARHPLDQLEILCRTTFCLIKASGRTQQSHETFQKVSQEIGAEPWADMINGEGGSSSSGDRWEGTQTLHRKESG